ncbi:MAG: outer membrane beta-barrel protein, partial [Bdellovibrionales bacterium]|nr:outer membrane beta-barrel protein [Bdellovibrionales bacterium]
KFVLMALVGVGFSSAFAAGQGGWSMGGNIGFINADQDDMNKEIEAGGVGASKFGNAWEVNGHIGYRISGSSIGLSFRPSYFLYTEEKGTDTAFSMSGFTIFPMMKWYMLEDQTIKFFSQFGIGYGHMSGSIEEATNSVDFSGGSLGYQAGLGAEFCFARVHCVNVEGNLRFLGVERFTVDSVSGTLVGAGSSKITQDAKGKELEINDRDFAGSMSGVLAMVGYTLYF